MNLLRKEKNAIGRSMWMNHSALIYHEEIGLLVKSNIPRRMIIKFQIVDQQPISI